MGPHCVEGPGNPDHPPDVYIAVHLKKEHLFRKNYRFREQLFPPNLGVFIAISECLAEGKIAVIEYHTIFYS